jgi:hypothetical protein
LTKPFKRGKILLNNYTVIYDARRKTIMGLYKEEEIFTSDIRKNSVKQL